MSRLADIPVRITAPDPSGDIAGIANMGGIGGIDAVLNEIATLLEHLGATGQAGAIDVRSLPLAPAEYDSLRTLLGTGEVTAAIEAQGPTHIHETAFHGVWWVMHRGNDNNVVAELIEVTLLPEILKTHIADARVAASGLRTLIAARRPSSIPI